MLLKGCSEDQLVDMRGCGLQSCLESLPCGDSCGLGSWEGLWFAWAFIPLVACPNQIMLGMLLGDGGLSRFIIYPGSLNRHTWVLLWCGLAWD